MKTGPSKAAKMANVARSTIYKDMDRGKLCFEKDGRGRTVIDVSELERVYGPFKKPDTSDTSDTSEDVRERHTKTVEKGSPDRALVVEVEMLREQIQRIDAMNERERATLERQIEDLRSDRDKWQSTVNLLTDQRQAQEAPGGRWGRAWTVLIGKA